MAGKDELDDLILEEDDNIIVLTDEEGNDTEFELLDAIDLDGTTYVVLLPTDEGEEEVVILQESESEDPDEFTYESVENDEILEKVFAMFKERFKDEFEFED